MKRNWFVIGATLIFIFVYQVYVLGPMTKKQIEEQKALQQKQTAERSHDPQISQKESLDKPNGNSTAITNNPETTASWQGQYDLQIGDKRVLAVSTGAALGPLTFGDYFQRGQKTKVPIVIQSMPLKWYSTNTQVQRCLNALNKVNESLFEAQTSYGSCHVSLMLDSNRPNVIDYKLSLRGFEDTSGHIELRGAGELGQVREDEQNTIAWKINESTKWFRGADVFKGEAHEGQVSWLAWGDKYFVTLMVPKGKYNPNLFKGRVSGQNGVAEYGFRYPLFPSVDNSIVYETDIYFGARDKDLILAMFPTAGESVDYGFFASVASVLEWMLKLIFKFTHNYGVAIIVLTLLVRALFWPLNKKVYVSALKMKELQPQMEAIRKKYENDKEKAVELNREVFALYKKHNVNPLGSCLPLLAQMPIFIGLYAALNHSMALYQAPFVGWIHDLSYKDPFYVFPILWTASLFAYIKLNPQPTQQQPGMPNLIYIQYGMNLLFGYLSKDWPAGLTLYLFVSNLVGIAQQLMLRRSSSLKVVQEGA